MNKNKDSISPYEKKEDNQLDSISIETPIKPISEFKQTYNVSEVNEKINSYLCKITDTYPFVIVEDNTAFKHYIDKETYHFNINIDTKLDDAFLRKNNIKGLKFPIGFDIDVEHATTQYVDYILDQIFNEFETYCEGIKIKYEEFKNPHTKPGVQHKVSYST